MSEEPKYETLRFADIATALTDIRNQFLTKKFPLVWNGPDDLHYSISAGSPPPSQHFSKEGLRHHKEQGRDFWDVYTMVAFQLGFHNGTVKQSKETDFWMKHVSTLQSILQDKISTTEEKNG